MAGEVNRFKRVLKVREVEREITQVELAVKQQREERILGTIDEITSERDEALSQFCSGKDAVISPQQLWFERQNLELMEKSLAVKGQELADCRVEIEETKVELLDKHRNVQLMEQYVDKLKTAETKKILDDEQKELDDITSMRYLRSVRSDMHP